MYETDMFNQIFFPVGFQSSVNPPHGFLNNLLIPGDQTEIIRDVMAAYLFYRCKHLVLLKFLVASQSSAEKSIYTAYRRLY